MRDPNNPCLFCNIEMSGLAHENNLAFASYDSYPVSEYHCLILPKRVRTKMYLIKENAWEIVND